jgi:hypothetical protein
MKTPVYLRLVILMILSSAGSVLKAQTSPAGFQTLGTSNPWPAKQLIEPPVLASIINSSNSKPLIFNIGAVEDIKGAIHIGPVSKKENLGTFKAQLKGLSPGTEIVIYCGCCPFAKCPNVRPAFILLQKLGFTHIKVLDLPVSLKKDWIEKGYPIFAGGIN